MLGRKEASGGMKRAQQGEGEGVARAAASDTTLTTTITTTSGVVVTMSEFISRFDEAAKRRVTNMNQKLRDLELQMEALEAEMCKANASVWGSSSYDA